VAQPAPGSLEIPGPVLFWEKESEKGKGYALGLVKETLTGKRPNVCCCLPALQGDQPSKESGEIGLGRDLARQLWRNGKRKSGKEVRL